MGTNYYWVHKADKCETCGRGEETRLHIGKSSMGWCFALHVWEPYEEPPEHAPEWLCLPGTLLSWASLFARPDSYIENEYGEVKTTQQMLDIIMHRGMNRELTPEIAQNTGGVIGPENLLRHPISAGSCIGHGTGTWDLCVGEFS